MVRITVGQMRYLKTRRSIVGATVAACFRERITMRKGAANW